MLRGINYLNFKEGKMSFKLNYSIEKLTIYCRMTKFNPPLVLNIRHLVIVFTFVNDRKKLKSKCNFMIHKNYSKLPLWKIVW